MFTGRNCVWPAIAIMGLVLCLSLGTLLFGPDHSNERAGKTHNISRSARLNRAGIAQLKLSGLEFLSPPAALSAGITSPIPAPMPRFEHASRQRHLTTLSLGCLSDRAPPTS